MITHPSSPAADPSGGRIVVGVDGSTLSEVFPDDRSAKLNSVVEEGSAAKVLIDASQSATILIVGSRGHGGFVGLMLG